jgi:hypothetical protein
MLGTNLRRKCASQNARNGVSPFQISKSCLVSS